MFIKYILINFSNLLIKFTQRGLIMVYFVNKYLSVLSMDNVYEKLVGKNASSFYTLAIINGENEYQTCITYHIKINVLLIYNLVRFFFNI